MLSLDLFDSKFERELREGAVDDLEYRRMNDLREKMEYLLKAYKKADSDEQRQAIMKRYNEYKSEREGYLKIREQQVPSKQDPFAYVKPEPRGIGDIQDPKTKMSQLAQKSKKGPLANVGAGLKGFLTGKEEPLDEQEISPRALGVANFQRLVKANMGNIPTVNFEFIRPEENFKLDQKGLDLISDYYDGLANDQAKNYFIYRVLPSGDETLKVLKQLGWTPAQPVQQELPGMPTQGELPLSEKKKLEAEPEFKAGDVKVARELQKLRAQYPAARSDVEAVARAEIDSSERNQRQLAAIRGANEKQDALLKQLVALDREQGQEIDALDQENNTLEKELAKIQTTNDRLQQTIGQMTGTKKATKQPAKTASKGIDLIPGAPADAKISTVAQTEPEPVVEPKTSRAPSPAMAAMAQQIQGLAKPAPTIRPAPGLKAANEPIEPKVAGSDIAEHGGGIGPRQHWQSMMRNEGWSDKYNPTPYSVYIDGREWKTFGTDDHARAVAEKVRANLKRQGRDQIVTIAPSQAYLKKGQIKETYNKKLELAADEFIKGIYDPAGPVYQAAYRSFQKGQAAEAILRKKIAQKYGVREKDLSDAETSHRASRLAGSRRKKDFDLVEASVRDTASATAVIACLLTGGSLTGCATAPEKTTTQQVLKTGQDMGRTIQTAKRITRAGVEAEVNQEIRNLARGLGNRPEELNHSNILRIWRRIQDRPPVTPEPQNEAKEIHTRDDFIKERDRLLRMMAQETNPANRQILKSAIRQLESRAENEGWIAMQQRMIRESNASGAAEQAILKRIMVSHRDLLQQYGPQKVMQAAEEVAYNVGDVDEIGTSDVSGWVEQVKQILGATA